MKSSGLPNQNSQIRVFISSTFRDMQAERDHLVTVTLLDSIERRRERWNL